jgi:hypothetical protein
MGYRSLLIVVLFLVTSIGLVGCTVYQSDGREAIEKNKAQIVTLSRTDGDPEDSFHIVCSYGRSTTDDIRPPAEVVETEFESRGFSTFLRQSAKAWSVVVYRSGGSGANDIHSQCLMTTEQGLTRERLRSAVELGVTHQPKETQP